MLFMSQQVRLMISNKHKQKTKHEYLEKKKISVRFHTSFFLAPSGLTHESNKNATYFKQPANSVS